MSNETKTPRLTPAQRRAAEAVRDGKVRRLFPWSGPGAPRLDAPPGVSAGPLHRLEDAGLIWWRAHRTHGQAEHAAHLTDAGRDALGGAS